MMKRFGAILLFTITFSTAWSQTLSLTNISISEQEVKEKKERPYNNNHIVGGISACVSFFLGEDKDFVEDFAYDLAYYKTEMILNNKMGFYIDFSVTDEEHPGVSVGATYLVQKNENIVVNAFGGIGIGEFTEDDFWYWNRTHYYRSNEHLIIEGGMIFSFNNFDVRAKIGYPEIGIGVGFNF